jgi:hypothetical protein
MRESLSKSARASRRPRARLAAATALALAAAVSAPSSPVLRADEPEYTWTFHLRDSTFDPTGRNTFFVLEPGYRLVLEGESDGTAERVEIAVLNETVVIAGRELRVVQEREEEEGVLVEVTRSYLGRCRETGSVFCGGQDVEKYENGAVVSREGSWRAFRDGARGGLVMPGLPILGSRYYQEYVPGVSLDRAEIVNLGAVADVPAGRFERCLRTRETSPLEPGEETFKTYAPGVGLVEDGHLKLVSHGFE